MAWSATRPPGGEQTVQGPEVDGPELGADRLDHLDADDGVEGSGDLAVVAEPYLHAVLEPGRADAGAGEVALFGGEGDGEHPGAAGGGADGQLAPSGADLQEPGALGDPGGVQQPVDLAVLGGGQQVVLGGEAAEDGGGVGERLVEEEGEQLVGQVVVVADVVPGALGGVELRRGPAQRPEAAQPLEGAGHEVGGVVGEHGQHADEVGCVPLPGHVGLAEADEPARADPPEEGVGVADVHERPAEADVLGAREAGAQGGARGRGGRRVRRRRSGRGRPGAGWRRRASVPGRARRCGLPTAPRWERSLHAFLGAVRGAGPYGEPAQVEPDAVQADRGGDDEGGTAGGAGRAAPGCRAWRGAARRVRSR